MTPCPLCHQLIPDLIRHYGSDDCPALLEAFGPLTGDIPARYANPAYWLTIRCRDCGRPVEARSRNRHYCDTCKARRVADRMQRAYARRKGGQVRPMRRWRWGVTPARRTVTA